MEGRNLWFVLHIENKQSRHILKINNKVIKYINYYIQRLFSDYGSAIESDLYSSSFTISGIENYPLKNKYIARKKLNVKYIYIYIVSVVISNV